MASQLSLAGAQSAKPVRFAPIYNARASSGIWTQRNPLRDAASTRLEEKFYGARNDALIDGANVEVSNGLTFIRRPGSSVYNSQTFPHINNFYEFRIFDSISETIKVMADTSAYLYDATGPSTQSVIWTKSANAGQTLMQSVGNTLYFGNGIDQKKWLQAAEPWTAGYVYTVGDFFIDRNGNIQSLQSLATNLTITELLVVAATAGQATQNFLIVTTSVDVPKYLPSNQPITFSGITAPAYTYLNGTTVNYSNIASGWNLNLTPQQFAVATTTAAMAGAVTPGTASTFLTLDDTGGDLTGTSGSVEPTWATAHGAITQDGPAVALPIWVDGSTGVGVGTGVTWMCFGSPVQDWGLDAAGGAPTLTGGPTTQYWQPKLDLTGYPQYGYAIIDSNSAIQLPYVMGITGGEQPIWNATAVSKTISSTVGNTTSNTNINTYLGNKTTDGSVVWMNVGQIQSWLPGYQYSTTITVIVDPNGNLQFTTDYFTTTTTWANGVANTAGAENTTGDTQPGAVVPARSWGYAYYYQTGDNVTVSYADSTVSGPDSTLVAAFTAYQNGGPPVVLNFSFTGVSSPIGPETVTVTGVGLSTPPGTGQPRQFYNFTFTSSSTASLNYQGSGHPGYTANYVGVSDQTSWNTTLGGTTIDNKYTWVNCGPAAQLTAGTLQYAQCYHAIDGSVSTASPVSYVYNAMVGAAAGMFGVQVLLTPSSNPQVDQIWLMRTTGGEAVLLYADTIPNVGPNAVYAYLDVLSDTSLDAEIEAPIDDSANPPPAGFLPSAYHLGRVWGFVNNTVYCSGGPDTITGNGNTTFPPGNSFVFPSKVTRLWESTQGLFVFTTSDIYGILGTTTSAFYSLPVVTGVGLLNYNAFDVNGSTPYMFTSDGQLGSISMGTGINEDGFPIGDQFLKVTTAGFNESLYNPNTAQVTCHIAGSPDKGLYVSDGSVGWFRLYPTPSPESGMTWAPFATIQGGAGMVQSVEVVPGTRNLLIGPVTSGPILKRDRSVWDDNGRPYEAYFTLGSLVLAQPGQLAEVAFITTDSVKIGTPPNLSIQLDEIAPYSAGYFESLPNTLVVPDPPQLSTSLSLYAHRYWLSNTQQPALCRHIQVRVDWGSTDRVQNELLSLSIYGGFDQESY